MVQHILDRCQSSFTWMFIDFKLEEAAQSNFLSRKCPQITIPGPEYLNLRSGGGGAGGRRLTELRGEITMILATIRSPKKRPVHVSHCPCSLQYSFPLDSG